MFLENSQNSQKNTCSRTSFLIKLQAEACNFIKKETLAQVLSCKFCGISKINVFTEYLPVTAFNFFELLFSLRNNYHGTTLENHHKFFILNNDFTDNVTETLKSITAIFSFSGTSVMVSSEMFLGQ